MTTPNPIDQSKPVTIDEELKRLYRCIWYDKQDGVDRENMFIKEAKLAINKIVTDVMAQIDEIEYGDEHYLITPVLVELKKLQRKTAHQYGLGE